MAPILGEITMKVLAFAASNSSTSINRKLVNYAANQIDAADVDLLDLNDYEMPLYSSDLEGATGIPQLAHDFRRKIADADLVMISFAEHNGSYTAAYKNLFDWTSRIDAKVFQGKRMILLATSPGRAGAKNVLAAAQSSMPHFGGEVLGAFSVPSFYENFDAENGVLRDDDLNGELSALLGTV